MRSSKDRILVSHAGNLPRPDFLDNLIDGGKRTEGAKGTNYHELLPKGVQYIVDKQIEHGVDVVNDGEYAKAGSYGGYIQERGSGYSLGAYDAHKTPKSAGTPQPDRRDLP